MSYSEYSSLFTVIVNDNRYSENSRIAIPCTIRDNYSLIIINNTNSTYSDSVNQLNLNENSKDFVIPLLFYTFYKLIKKYKFLNLDRILSDFDEISANNGRLYYTRYRERFIFLSCLFVSNSVEDAYQNYYQTEKRCVIRDYWQWLGYEGVHDNSLPEIFESEDLDINSDMGLQCRIIKSNICIELDTIIPEDYLWSNENYILKDYGFDPRDGIWKRLKYKSLPCQREDIIKNYNPQTCEIYKFSTDNFIYKIYENKYNPESIITKAIIPIKLTQLILKTMKDMKEYYEFLMTKEKREYYKHHYNHKLLKKLKETDEKRYNNIVAYEEKMKLLEEKELLENEGITLSPENIIEKDEELGKLMRLALDTSREQYYLLQQIIKGYFPKKYEFKSIEKQ